MTLRYLALNCSQCSAPLEVAADREQISCGYCGSMLHVSHLQIPAATSDERPSVHPRQAEIDQLDAEWATYRKESLPTSSAGELVIPDPVSCLAGAWMTGIIGGVIALVALGFRAWEIAVIVAVVCMGLIFVMLKQAKIAPVYERSLHNYQRLRRELVSSPQV